MLLLVCFYCNFETEKTLADFLNCNDFCLTEPEVDLERLKAFYCHSAVSYAATLGSWTTKAQKFKKKKKRERKQYTTREK